MVHGGATTYAILIAENAIHLEVWCLKPDPTHDSIKSAQAMYVCDGMCVDLSM